MNIAFYILVILAATALWFLCSFLFKPLGKFFTKIFKDTKDIINEQDEKEKEDKEVNG